MKKSRIRRVSKKRAKENVILRKKSDIFLKKNPECVIKSEVCTHQATVVHHGRGRCGAYLLDEQWWFASCVMCNGYLENNKKWGVDRGFRLDRLGNL